ncbi:putative ankyrin repeat protein RF_0381 [Mytilus edulis]|uniref:putative ankyrin repeat protein RF_0381 n=1 Tax=Mytilus edulis TaxID=6550 RepID=UPI0039F1098A
MIPSQKQKHLCEDFLNAVYYGDKEKLLLCLKNGANINHTGGNGNSALHRAALNEQLKFVKLLIDRGIDCNLKNWDRESALHSATSNKKTEITKFLIKSHIDCNIQDKDGKSALHHATINRKIEIVKALIDGSIDLNLQDEDGKSALHHATLNRKIEIVKALIDGSIDLNLQDEDGLTALHEAIQYGHTNIANLLICTTGMNLNLQNKDGLTALHIATKEGNIKIVHLLIDKNIDMNIQETNAYGWTALHRGVWHGKKEIVHLLIEKGIGRDLQAKDGSTALHLAAHLGSTEIGLLLIAHDKAINLQDNDGNSALHHAAWKGRTQFAKMLLDRRIDINLQDKNGFTALHNCALYEKEDIMQLLIDKNIDLNLQTKVERTALHYAADKNLIESIKILIEKGCEKNIQDIDGNTALHIVASNNRVKMVSYMLDSNCDPTIRNLKGKKPIDLTSYRPNRKLFKVFEKTLLPGLPVEVKKFDKKSAQVFASLLEQENYPHYESRVMLVGEHGTGKTTIARYLVGKSPTKPKVKSTDGIELTNGLSYIDRATKTWLVGEQDFSLEEVTTSRSLLHKVRIQKSVHATPTTKHTVDTHKHESFQTSGKNVIPDSKHPTIQLNISENMVNPQLETGSKKGDIASTSQVSIETVRAINDPKNPGDACLKSGSSGNTHTQAITITQPGPLRRLKNFFGVTKKVEEVKVTITKDKFFKMVSKVGKKMLHNKMIAPVVIWDFGGQDVFYSTHQTFLTYRALYMIVLDGSRKLDDPCPHKTYLPGKSGDKTARDYLRFWINTIVTYCKGSVEDFPKIMIVLTHKDKVQSVSLQ